MKLVNELRIGNLVEIIQRTKGIYTTIEASCLYLNRIDLVYKPIPITKDLVLRLGFHYSVGIDLYKKREILMSTEFIVFLGNTWVQIEYVHQLQNLYFALTGEELTLKP
jgi:hypothetical protein